MEIVMNKLEQVIFQFRNELGSDFISTDVVGMDGLSIGGGSLNPNFDAADISARFAEVMKLAVKISTKIDIGKVDDNLVTTDTTYIISRFLGEGHYYWVVVVSSNATLGTVRMLMNEFAPQITDAIPQGASVVSQSVINSKAEEPKIEEKPKQEKGKKNFWSDAKQEKDEEAEERALKMYKFP
jgi:predicted regulator of Ras-like GTPase activity (Roadblock/LC7/MglB family)